MTRSRWAGVLGGCVCLLVASGCVSLRGPRDLCRAVADESETRLEREVSLTLGRSVLALASRFADEPGFPRHLTGVQVGVYRVDDADGLRLLGLEVPGYDALVRVRDDDSQAVVLVRHTRGGIREMAILACDGEELAIVRLRGRLDETVAELIAQNTGADDWVAEARGLTAR